MNWRIRETISGTFLMMSEGYFSSVEINIKNILEDNWDKKADSLIFPVLFNFIHAMELSLKAILCSIENLLGQKNNHIQNGHDIRQLYNTIISRLRNKGLKKDIEQFIEVECIIRQIYQKTNLMDFARYPIDAHKSGHFYIKEYENVVVDLEVLLHYVEICKDVLLRMGDYYNYKVIEGEAII